MNATGAPMRVSRKLVVIVAAAAAGVAGAGLYAAVGRGPERSGNASTPETRPAEGAAAAAVTLKPRTGRTLSVGDASKELELIRPTRPKLAEDFTLPLADGKSFRLADHRGKVVLINFWATWCGPCREEMPAMERLWQQQKDQGFMLVAVSVDTNAKSVNPYLTKLGLTFPVALDPKMDLGNTYGVRALPSSFIVDREGHVVALALGPRPWDNDASQSLIEGLLK
jgi:peroxiredoxin